MHIFRRAQRISGRKILKQVIFLMYTDNAAELGVTSRNLFFIAVPVEKHDLLAISPFRIERGIWHSPSHEKNSFIFKLLIISQFLFLTRACCYFTWKKKI